MIFPKNKNQTKESTWRDYRWLIVLIVTWLVFVEAILLFDPIIINIVTPYEAQFEFVIFTTLVSFWMLIAYWFGRKKDFTRKWMIICCVAATIATIMLMIEQHFRYFPPRCTYEILGDSFFWIRTRWSCGIFVYGGLF